jgi:hypothetical protein
MMKKWENHKDPTGQELYTLAFGHHLEEPKIVVCLFRDSDGDWRTTSDLLGTFWTFLTDGKESEYDAKNLVEEMVCERYEDQMRYYQEIFNEFGNS